MNKNDIFLCPSAPLTNESFLFGRIDKHGQVQYMDGVISVHLNTFEKIKCPEKHFRFTMPCKSTECAQWQNGKCSIGTTLKLSDISHLDHSISENCAIKSSCRWFYQEGETACYSCKYLRTSTVD